MKRDLNLPLFILRPELSYMFGDKTRKEIEKERIDAQLIEYILKGGKIEKHR